MVKGVVLTLTAAALAVLPAPAQARQSDPPCEIHGTILEGEITTIESEAAHGNTETFVFEHPIFFDGNLSGVGLAEERNVFHIQNNTVDVQAKVAFTGTATCSDGRVLGTGGLEINFN